MECIAKSMKNGTISNIAAEDEVPQGLRIAG